MKGSCWIEYELHDNNLLIKLPVFRYLKHVRNDLLFFWFLWLHLSSSFLPLPSVRLSSVTFVLHSVWIHIIISVTLLEKLNVEVIQDDVITTCYCVLLMKLICSDVNYLDFNVFVRQLFLLLCLFSFAPLFLSTLSLFLLPLPFLFKFSSSSLLSLLLPYSLLRKMRDIKEGYSRFSKVVWGYYFIFTCVFSFSPVSQFSYFWCIPRGVWCAWLQKTKTDIE